MGWAGEGWSGDNLLEAIWMHMSNFLERSHGIRLGVGSRVGLGSGWGWGWGGGKDQGWDWGEDQGWDWGQLVRGQGCNGLRVLVDLHQVRAGVGFGIEVCWDWGFGTGLCQVRGRGWGRG